ncbi:hypothetical protein D3C80_1797210 [compost metagenome]
MEQKNQPSAPGPVPHDEDHEPEGSDTYSFPFPPANIHQDMIFIRAFGPEIDRNVPNHQY